MIKNPTTKLSNKTKIILAIILLISIVSVIAFAYFQKAPDADYTNAVKNIENMSSNIARITSLTESVSTSNDITSELVDKIDGHIKTYNSNLESLSTNSAILQDRKVQSVFEKNNYTGYRDSTTKLIVALDAYLAITNKCSTLVDKLEEINTTKQFDKSGAECTASINVAKTLVDQKFGDQFLSQYTLLSDELYKNYRDIINLAEARTDTLSLDAINATKSRIMKLGENKLNITPSQNSLARQNLDTLKKILTSQKTSLLNL